MNFKPVQHSFVVTDDSCFALCACTIVRQVRASSVPSSTLRHLLEICRRCSTSALEALKNITESSFVEEDCDHKLIIFFERVGEQLWMDTQGKFPDNDLLLLFSQPFCTVVRSQNQSHTPPPHPITHVSPACTCSVKHDLSDDICLLRRLPCCAWHVGVRLISSN